MTGYEASERFWARIIMHMLIMRIIPIIMLSKRTNSIFGSLLSCDGLIIDLSCHLVNPDERRTCILVKLQEFFCVQELDLEELSGKKGRIPTKGRVVNRL